MALDKNEYQEMAANEAGGKECYGKTQKNEWGGGKDELKKEETNKRRGGI